MTTYTKVLLSGSTNGRVIPVVATATPGTLIHTADATAIDEIWLWVSNITTSDTTITLQWGGVLNPTDYMVAAYNIPAQSQPIPIVIGVPLTNSLVVRAFSTTASALNAFGFVNRIT